MAYACVRTDNLSGTVLGQDLVSLKYEDGDIENGTVMEVGSLLEDEREVREAKIPASGATDNLVVIATPEIVRDKTYYDLSDFINKAGEIMRGYRLTPHGIFSVTLEAFADGVEPAVDDEVGCDGNGKLTTGSGFGTIVEIAEAGGRTWYAIEVNA